MKRNQLHCYQRHILLFRDNINNVNVQRTVHQYQSFPLDLYLKLKHFRAEFEVKIMSCFSGFVI